jgi:hypothetical protein
MQQTSAWSPHCAFVRDYFFGVQQNYVGEGVSELRPDTDVSELVADSIRRRIDMEDFTMVRDGDLFAEVDLKESITFKQLVNLVDAQRRLST